MLDGVYVGALLNGSRFSQSRIRQTDQDGRTTVSVAQIDAFEQLAATDAEDAALAGIDSLLVPNDVVVKLVSVSGLEEHRLGSFQCGPDLPASIVFFPVGHRVVHDGVGREAEQHTVRSLAADIEYGVAQRLVIVDVFPLSEYETGKMAIWLPVMM